MLITACTHAALRILAACARADGASLTMSEMAADLAISDALAVKACHRLMRSGYLAGIRGRGGGYRLARPPETITLFEIVELCEDENDFFPCRLRADGDCRVAPICRLRSLCAEAWDAYARVLGSTTLADVAADDPPTAEIAVP